MYDIMCQYGVHLYDRFKESPYLKIPDGMTICGGIGQFHVHGHQDSCFARFAPNFIVGAGQVDGEIIETLWANLNLIAGSTRHMSVAHRREIMDAHMNDSNWKKLVRMGNILVSFHYLIANLLINSENAGNQISKGDPRRRTKPKII